MNPSGGLKAQGHPIGASGLASTVEVALRLRQEAGARQVEGARVGLVQSIGGTASGSYVFVWSRRGGLDGGGQILTRLDARPMTPGERVVVWIEEGIYHARREDDGPRARAGGGEDQRRRRRAPR